MRFSELKNASLLHSLVLMLRALNRLFSKSISEAAMESSNNDFCKALHGRAFTDTFLVRVT